MPATVARGIGAVFTESRLSSRSGSSRAEASGVTIQPVARQTRCLSLALSRLSARRVISTTRNLRLQERSPENHASTTTRCVLTPQSPSAGTEGDGKDDEKPSHNTWARISPTGAIKSAVEIWADATGRGSSRLAAAQEWSGRPDRPTKKVPFSDVLYSPKRHKFFNREWSSEDIVYTTFIVCTHLACLAAPFCFTMTNLALFLGGWVVTGLFGITFSYHRQLSHKSFSTPKWVEYLFAYCGVQAVQGDPIEWVSSHRYHHKDCDTPKDPHTPYEGFWWSHAGWFLDSKATLERVGDRSNADDMAKQPFYRHLQAHYGWHIGAAMVAYLAIGGWGAFVWGFCMRVCWVHHITWFVNSACHVWGSQPYNTGDLSRNNWWVGLLAFGEGWHNNHHAFEFSARHGLEWYQLDMTWMAIKFLSFFGLVSKIKLPTQAQLDRLSFEKQNVPASA